NELIMTSPLDLVFFGGTDTRDVGSIPYRGNNMKTYRAKPGKENRAPVLVDFALQGGGSHGAFTWGVLDRLLEEPWLQVEAISGTSAGAMNAAVLVSGYMQGGAAGARAALDFYWKRVANAAKFSPLQRSLFDRLMNRWTLDTSPA